MSNRRIGAFFFLLRHEELTPSLDELAITAGVTSLSLGPWPEDEEEDARYGEWGVLDSVRVCVRHLSMHDCLVIDFLQSDLHDLRARHRGHEDVPLEEDDALPVALAFRDACERLCPEAAVLATHPQMIEEPQWLLDCYSAVLGMDPDLLDSYLPGLMYVGPEMAADWDPGRFEIERDSLPVKDGKLFFRETGRDRWI